MGIAQVRPAASGVAMVHGVAGKIGEMMANSLPVVEGNDEKCRGMSWLFLTMMDLVALGSSTTTLPKLIAAADRVTGTMPVPVSATDSD